MKPDLYILGEIWTSSRSWLDGEQFHGVMNYSLVGNIIDYFVEKQIPTRKMANVLNEQLMQYRKQTQETMFNMLDSHDVPRILTMANGDIDLVKATLTFMFMMHGTPCIYYGTEVGMMGGADPQNRRCMVWDEEQQDRVMYDFTKELIAFRKEFQPLLSYGFLKWDIVLDEEKVVGVKRHIGDEALIAYFNQGEEDFTIEKDPNAKVVFGRRNTETETGSVLEPNGFSIHLVRQ